MKAASKYMIRYFFALCMVVPLCSAAQLKRYHFNQVDSLQKIEKRKLVVFIHADWCRYCEGMNNTTFKNKEIISVINRDFYFIDLNAEEQKNISFAGNNYVFKPTGRGTGIHELAQQMATIENSLSYPTLCFMNDGFEILLRLTNYVKAKDLLYVLQQFL